MDGTITVAFPLIKYASAVTAPAGPTNEKVLKPKWLMGVDTVWKFSPNAGMDTGCVANTAPVLSYTVSVPLMAPLVLLTRAYCAMKPENVLHRGLSKVVSVTRIS